ERLKHYCSDHKKRWLREPDLNRRPSGYEPDELPGCSIPRQRLRILRRVPCSVNSNLLFYGGFPLYAAAGQKSGCPDWHIMPTGGRLVGLKITTKNRRL